MTIPTDATISGARTCLVLMHKAPSRSKQRLAAEVGAAATQVADRLLACACEDAAAWDGPVCYAPADAAAAEWLVQAFGVRPLVVEQHGLNLGERIAHVAKTLRTLGFDRQIYIGIDCPELDARYLQTARANLDRCDLVVGPAADGGAVLIAMRRPLLGLELLPWSTERLERSLVDLAASQGFVVGELATLRDVDTLADLHAVVARLDADARPARRALRAAAAMIGVQTRAAT